MKTLDQQRKKRKSLYYIWVTDKGRIWVIETTNDRLNKLYRRLCVTGAMSWKAWHCALRNRLAEIFISRLLCVSPSSCILYTTKSIEIQQPPKFILSHSRRNVYLAFRMNMMSTFSKTLLLINCICNENLQSDISNLWKSSTDAMVDAEKNLT